LDYIKGKFKDYYLKKTPVSKSSAEHSGGVRGREVTFEDTVGVHEVTVLTEMKDEIGWGNSILQEASKRKGV